MHAEGLTFAEFLVKIHIPVAQEGLDCERTFRGKDLSFLLGRPEVR
jgi:hypothetical protein